MARKRYVFVIVILIIGVVIGYLASSYINKFSKYHMGTKDDNWKIKNAMRAAPESVSKDATVYDWPDKDGAPLRLLRKGTNKWTCVPDDLHTPRNDPICADENSMMWLDSYMAQKTPKLTQPGIAYMLQGGSSPSNTDPFAVQPKQGESWMSEPPHLMIFPTEKLDPKIYSIDPMSGQPWIMYPGTPYEHLMVPVGKMNKERMER